MKKNYLLFLTFLCSGLCSFAQQAPILTASSITNFSIVNYNVPNLTGVTLGSAGANQNWNYSNLIPDTSFAFFLSTVPASTAPGHSNFPSTNLCIKSSYTYLGTTSEGYSFSYKSASGIESFGQTDAQGTITGQYIDTQFLPLPLHYLDTYLDTYQRLSDTNPTTTTNTYDAYGTLITPYGTFTNVIREKSVRSNSTSTQYSWYQISPTYLPVMGMTVNNLNVVTDVSLYANATGLGNNQNSITNKITAYPNPATNILNLQVPTNTTIDKIIITDLLGKIIKEDTQNTTVINVENLSNGLYVLQAFSNVQKMETKFVKQ